MQIIGNSLKIAYSIKFLTTVFSKFFTIFSDKNLSELGFFYCVMGTQVSLSNDSFLFLMIEYAPFHGLRDPHSQNPIKHNDMYNDQIYTCCLRDKQSSEFFPRQE